mmetsp:Transcript_10720/g.11568  ORF Transcript_10720/g.11568 Transcript_10720/m.11568 type:complete len:86 (-) Transcript_10720:4559-4816(-)
MIYTNILLYHIKRRKEEETDIKQSKNKELVSGMNTKGEYDRLIVLLLYVLKHLIVLMWFWLTLTRTMKMTMFSSTTRILLRESTS